MATPILTASATILCAHSGSASAINPETRVKAGGSPVIVISTQHSISGCALPTTAGGPCVTGTWLTPANRVRANGQPVVLQSASSTCVPTGTPMNVVQTQTRVSAT